MPELTPAQAADFFGALASRWPERARRILEEGRDEALDLAETYSSAPPLTPEERREAPFAARHGTPLMDPSIIHIGSGESAGRLAASWNGTVSGDAIRIWNNSPEWDYMAGTETMVERPLAARVEAELGPVIAGRLEAAFAALMEGRE
jgi:hypothetical protein